MVLACMYSLKTAGDYDLTPVNSLPVVEDRPITARLFVIVHTRPTLTDN